MGRLLERDSELARLHGWLIEAATASRPSTSSTPGPGSPTRPAPTRTGTPRCSAPGPRATRTDGVVNVRPRAARGSRRSCASCHTADHELGRAAGAYPGCGHRWRARGLGGDRAGRDVGVSAAPPAPQHPRPDGRLARRPGHRRRQRGGLARLRDRGRAVVGGRGAGPDGRDERRAGRSDLQDRRSTRPCGRGRCRLGGGADACHRGRRLGRAGRPAGRRLRHPGDAVHLVRVPRARTDGHRAAHVDLEPHRGRALGYLRAVPLGRADRALRRRSGPSRRRRSWPAVSASRARPPPSPSRDRRRDLAAHRPESWRTARARAELSSSP